MCNCFNMALCWNIITGAITVTHLNLETMSALWVIYV